MQHVYVILWFLISNTTCLKLSNNTAPTITPPATLAVSTTAGDTFEIELKSKSGSPCSKSWQSWIDSAADAVSSAGEPSYTSVTRTGIVTSEIKTRYEMCNKYQSCGDTVRIQLAGSPTLVVPKPTEIVEFKAIGPSPLTLFKPPPNCSLVEPECETTWTDVASKMSSNQLWSDRVVSLVGPYLKELGKDLFGCPVPKRKRDECDYYSHNSTHKDLESSMLLRSHGFCSILPSGSAASLDTMHTQGNIASIATVVTPSGQEDNPIFDDVDQDWVYLIRRNDEQEDSVFGGYRLPDPRSADTDWKSVDTAWKGECLDAEELEWMANANSTHRPALEIPQMEVQDRSGWWSCADVWTAFWQPLVFNPAAIIQRPILPPLQSNSNQDSPRTRPGETNQDKGSQDSQLPSGQSWSQTGDFDNRDEHHHPVTMLGAIPEENGPLQSPQGEPQSPILLTFNGVLTTATVQAGLPNIVLLDSKRLSVGGPAYTISNHAVSLASGGIVIDDTSTVPLSSSRKEGTAVAAHPGKATETESANNSRGLNNFAGSTAFSAADHVLSVGSAKGMADGTKAASWAAPESAKTSAADSHNKASELSNPGKGKTVLTSKSGGSYSNHNDWWSPSLTLGFSLVLLIVL